jgi:hypothetical protein
MPLTGASLPAANDFQKKGNFQMTETDDEALKVEIDEIMNRVELIMDKVARFIPEDTKDSNGGESPNRAP